MKHNCGGFSSADFIYIYHSSEIRMLTPLDFETKLDIFKTLKILCTTIRHLTKIEHGPHGDEIWIFGSFLS
jgi:hypothetical protein